jgi:hypothetical protein
VRRPPGPRSEEAQEIAHGAKRLEADVLLRDADTKLSLEPADQVRKRERVEAQTILGQDGVDGDGAAEAGRETREHGDETIVLYHGAA